MSSVDRINIPETEDQGERNLREARELIDRETAAMSEHVTHVEQLDAPIDVIANAIAADKGYTTAEGFHDVAAIILGCLVGAGFRIVRTDSYERIGVRS